MRTSIYLLIIPILLSFSSCQDEVFEKETLLKEFDLSDLTNTQKGNVTIAEKTISYEGSKLRILIQFLQNDSIRAIKKIAFYQSGNKKITISNIQITDPINIGTLHHAVMSVSGSFQFNKQSFFKTQIIGESFTVDGRGLIMFDSDTNSVEMLKEIVTERSLGDIVNIIERNSDYKTAKNNPSITTTSDAMDFIINKSGLKDFNTSKDVITQKFLSDYFQVLFDTNKDYVLNPENKTSFQLQGHKLNEIFKNLVINGSIGNMPFKNDLKKLTELVKSITIPIASPVK